MSNNAVIPATIINSIQFGLQGVSEFMDIADVPYREWLQRLKFYELMYEHYSGQSLAAHAREDAETMLFPLRDNIFAKFVDLHSALIWGAETDSRLINFYTEQLVTVGDEGGSVPQDSASIMGAVLLENDGYTKLRMASRLFGIFGEVVIGLTYNDKRATGSSLSVLWPQSVIPVFDQDGDLVEAWIVYWISSATAKLMGWRSDDEDRVIYAEHWTRDRWEVKIGFGDKGQYALDENGNKMVGENIFETPYGEKQIPYKFIHRLSIGDEGKSLIEPIVGLVQEINSRASDMGDAIRESTHQKFWVANYKGEDIYIREYEDGRVINLGTSIGDMAKPEIGALNPVGQPETNLKMLGWLEDQVRQDTQTAAVILGIDEGSQRSGETMAARALPTIAIVNDYRDSWGGALAFLAQSAIVNYNLKANAEISLRNLIVRADFNPILSRDREVVARVETQLVTSGIRSTQEAIKKLGDVRNVEEELDLIEEEKQKAADQALKQTLAKSASDDGKSSSDSERSKQNGRKGSNGNTDAGK